MKVKDLIKELKEIDGESRVLLSSDEEQNTLFEDVRIIKYDVPNDTILFGCSGSEVEDED